MGLQSRIHELKTASGTPPMQRQTRDPAVATNWSIVNVNDWLRREEYGLYSSLFYRRKINGPALLRMRDADLALLGIKVHFHFTHTPLTETGSSAPRGHPWKDIAASTNYRHERAAGRGLDRVGCDAVAG